MVEIVEDPHRRFIYYCDMCSTELTVDNVVTLQKKYKKKSKGIAHLCPRCLVFLEKSIKAYKIKKEKRDEIKK